MVSRNITVDDVITTARLYNVPPELALAVWDQESSKNSGVGKPLISPKGAIGPFQLMPDTFKDMLPNGDIYNPVDNMVAGIKYLAKGLKRSGGDPEGALQFYYGHLLKPGEEGATSGPGTPTIRRYAKQVLGRIPNALSKIKGSDSGSYGVAQSAAPPQYAGLDPSFSSQPEVDLGLFGSNGEEINNEEDMPDIAGLTRPLDQGNNDWMDQVGSREDYELDKYIRQLVDEEFSNRNS